MRLIDLGYKYKTVEVRLHGEHSFKPGDLVHLTGVNGSGKSTILKILAGILEGYTGTCELPPEWSVRYVPTSINSSLFLPWYTIQKNIELLVGDEPARVTAHALGQRFLNSTFHRLLDQPSYTTSAGESAAIAIACAVAAEPYALFLDETLSFAAPVLAVKVAEVLEAFVDRGGLLFVAGHHQLPFTKMPRALVMERF